MKQLIFILPLAFLLPAGSSFGQDTLWKHTSHWKLYDIHNKKGFTYSVDTLQYFKNVELDDNLMHGFLGKTILWPPEKYSMWMGLFIASYETKDKEMRKIVISSYGGFLYDALTKRYFEIPENDRAAWYQLIHNSADKIALK